MFLSFFWSMSRLKHGTFESSLKGKKKHKFVIHSLDLQMPCLSCSLWSIIIQLHNKWHRASIDTKLLDIIQLFFLLFLLFSYCIAGPMTKYIYKSNM